MDVRVDGHHALHCREIWCLRRVTECLRCWLVELIQNPYSLLRMVAKRFGRDVAGVYWGVRFFRLVVRC